MAILSLICCMSNTVEEEGYKHAEYVTDGLIVDNNDTDKEKGIIEKNKEELGEFISIEENQFVVDYDSMIGKGILDEEQVDFVMDNIEFANNMALERPDIVSIEDDFSLSFNIEDEYVEQWNGWLISWTLWEGWRWKLDSDFGKMVGIIGTIWGIYKAFSSAKDIYESIKKLTKNNIDDTISAIYTLAAQLPSRGVSNVISDFLTEHAVTVVSTLISLNLSSKALDLSTLGISWVFRKLISMIISNCLPSLITSASMVYNCFRYNVPIYCRISLASLSIDYSLNEI